MAISLSFHSCETGVAQLECVRPAAVERVCRGCRAPSEEQCADAAMV